MKYEGYEGEMMFTISDLRKLMGKVHESTLYREHERLRKAICGDKRGFITLREFCEYKKMDFKELLNYLK